MISISKILSYLGLDQLIVRQLSVLYQIGTYSSTWFIVVVFLSIVILQLLSTSKLGVLVAIVAIPIAIDIGINPWTVVFITVVAAGCWFFPYQRVSYMMLSELLGKEVSYDERKLLLVNAVLSCFSFIGVLASIVYWRVLSIL